jgi:hypothetical protein
MMKENRSVAVVVSKDWSEQGKVRQFLGPTDVPLRNPEETSHLIIAKLISDSDHRGLWIELNTDRQRFHDRPVFNMLIPWQYIFSIITTPDAPRSVGFPIPGDQAEVTRLEVAVADSLSEK